jgi:hypothetical protein
MKKQLHEFKLLLNQKEDEILMLKMNSKVTRYHDLENKLKSNTEELSMMIEKFNFVKMSLTE